MSSPSGHCRCGQISWHSSDAPRVSFVCHCRQCQRRTGPATGIMLFDDVDVEIVGDLMAVQDIGGSGGPVEIYRCVTCGSPVSARIAPVPWARIIYAAALDDHQIFVARFHQWAEEKPSWLELPISAIAFDRAAEWNTLGGPPRPSQLEKE